MKEQDGQVISYIDGWAWGIAPDGRTICLGTESTIRAVVVNPRKCITDNPLINEIISLEQQLIREGN